VMTRSASDGLGIDVHLHAEGAPHTRQEDVNAEPV